jgi:hypothetical protein
MIVDINKKQYNVLESEFIKIEKNIYSHLFIRKDLGLFERISSLLVELSTELSISNTIFIDQTHGGFIPINSISKLYSGIIINNSNSNHNDNIIQNINLHNINNLKLVNTLEHNDNYINNLLVYSENIESIDKQILDYYNPIILTKYHNSLKERYKYYFYLTDTYLCLYIPEKHYDKFYTQFHYFINNKQLNYDNLNHLCIMVKDAGPQFEEMLIQNLPYFDKWTILDTGSTDSTIQIINKVLVGKKKGQLFQEPFINFRDSRNRCLELAGSSCKFITILDDTYVINGNLRHFLNDIRGDQFSDSFTLVIQTNDIEYGSNRIIKSNRNLKYIYKIHEVISDKENINICIPKSVAYIVDHIFDYMDKRTFNRKENDLKLLYEEVNENPQDPRSYYYLAQTYNLLKDYDKAFYYYNKRTEFINSGFLQERVDAAFEAARLANFYLNKPWNECEELYNKCYKIDESRPEALYFIGIHYYNENNYKKAFEYFKKGFEIGFPFHCQYSLKPTLSYHFLPKFLTRICYELNEYAIGEQVSQFFINNNKPDADDYNEIISWNKIFNKLNIYQGSKTPTVPHKPFFCFVADGGFTSWTGSTILTSALGGSETYIIEMARYIQQSGLFDVYVFCNTPNKLSEIFEGVKYNHIDNYYEFINTNYVHSCIISRYSEYLPVTFKGFSENVYLVVHDLTPSGIIIPIDKKLKNIFCLTEWHTEYFINIFPGLKSITVPFYNGIDIKTFNYDDTIVSTKQKNKFIYSSFPNRGLLQLLQMWPKIYEHDNTCSLHIYSDLKNDWCNKVEPDKIREINYLLKQYKDQSNGLNIYYHGWVNKSELADAWKTADIWFYPCTFAETFCLTALEAAISKTFVITNDLAALQNTVGNRGAIIKGDPLTSEWKDKALEQIFYYMDTNNFINKYNLIIENYNWAINLSWENQAKQLLDNYILPNGIIEYKGMYNWTNDVPFGSKSIFLKIINDFNQTYYKVKSNEKIIVLEIGSYTGVSLINIVKAIPNSFGIAIDMWTSYNENNLLENMDSLKIEQSFFNNVNVSGLADRIIGIKSSSTNKLLEYIKEGFKADFIYVDGSHLLLDCYIDLVLSWEILEINGILAIDDYLFKHDEILKSPFEAVNHFFKIYNNKYVLLDIGYRVFLKKIC